MRPNLSEKLALGFIVLTTVAGLARRPGWCLAFLIIALLVLIIPRKVSDYDPRQQRRD